MACFKLMVNDFATAIAALDPIKLKGGLDCSTNPNYPAGNTGDQYRVTVAGKLGGASGPAVQVGDSFYCLEDSVASGDHATVGAKWVILQTNVLNPLEANGTVPLTANWDVGSFKITAQQLESDVATGTAPLVVASTTAVANLNADLLDGLQSTALAILAGQSGGQTLNGGTGAGENLTLVSTANATKGKILFGTSGYDGVNNRLGIGNAVPNTALDVTGAITGSGILSIDDTTESTSTITGSIHTDGGLGVVKNCFVGGSSYVGGNEFGVGTTTIADFDWFLLDAGFPQFLIGGGFPQIGFKDSTNNRGWEIRGTDPNFVIVANDRGTATAGYNLSAYTITMPAWVSGASGEATVESHSWKVGNGATTVKEMLFTSDDITIPVRLKKPGTFGGIHVHDASTAQAIATGATYTKLTAFTDDSASSNVTPDAANDKITITKAGYYRVSGSFNFSSGTNNIAFKIAAFLNGVEQDQIHVHRKVSTAGDVGSASFTGFIDVTTVPWDLDVRARHDNGGSVDLTITYANFNVEYCGET